LAGKWAFAVRNDGSYSQDGGDLQPLLPNGALLENGFTGGFSEPRFGAIAGTIGEVGIVTVTQGGNVTGYSITGFGKEAVIITLTNGN